MKYKSQGNPLQNTIKLLLNSIYGKSILKSVDTDIMIIDKSRLEEYTVKYYNHFEKIIVNEKSDKAFIKRIKSVNKHFNTPQFGATVLSWSKHLMNRVICLAEQNGIDIYYTDTDSIHIKESDIPKLSELFSDKYGQDLIGKNLTQYHTDFEPIKGKPSHSTKLIALGKKSYLDVLENDDGERDYHIRLKGIPNQVILNHCNKNNYTVEELYQQLYEGSEVEFDLTDGSNCFKKTQLYEQVTLDKFKRKVSFN
jgi:hypothetical protein